MQRVFSTHAIQMSPDKLSNEKNANRIMNDTSTLSQSTSGGQSSGVRPNRPGLRLPSIALLIYWVATFAARPVDKPYFFGFMYGLAAAGLLTLLVLGWWWFNRAVRLRDKVLGFAFLLGEAVVVAKLAHPSISGFTLWISGFPLVATFVIAWLLVVKQFGMASPRRGLAMVVTLVWAYFLVVRFDGADSKFNIRTHWRWTPTPEEQFLAKAHLTATRGTLLITNVAAEVEPLAGDWTSFRGPERDGVIHGTTITTNWSLTQPSPVWKHS